MAKEHPSIFKGDILRFHFVTGGSLDLAVIYHSKPEGGCFLLVNLKESMIYREYPARISDVQELEIYHNAHRGDNLAVVSISIVRHLCEVF